MAEHCFCPRCGPGPAVVDGLRQLLPGDEENAVEVRWCTKCGWEQEGAQVKAAIHAELEFCVLVATHGVSEAVLMAAIRRECARARMMSLAALRDELSKTGDYRISSLSYPAAKAVAERLQVAGLTIRIE